MSLRTAPCPTCKSTIVFGERACRSCKMPFNYGPNPPREPTQSEVFDALLDAPDAPATSTAPPRTAPSGTASATPSAKPPERRNDPPPMAGLDTGRFSVGEVDVDDVPGLIDSTLFAAFTPATVEVDHIPGLETTQQAVGDVEVRSAPIPGLDNGNAEVGDVQVQSVPGLFGSDIFRTDTDVPAGAEQSLSVLDISPNAGLRRKEHVVVRHPCPTCGTVYAENRCPSCGTALLDHDDN